MPSAATHTVLIRAFRAYRVVVATREDVNAQMAALRIWGKGRRPTARQRARFAWSKAEEARAYAAWQAARSAIV